jgi:HSP20 family protein
MHSMHSQLDDMFNSLFTSSPTAQAAPAMDVYTEDDKHMVLEVHAPGFDKDDVEVNVHNGMLEIKGEKHEQEEDKKGKKRSYMIHESHASFYRRLALPDYADAEHVDAHFDSGVLKVTVPFKALPKPKKVTISSGKK